MAIMTSLLVPRPHILLLCYCISSYRAFEVVLSRLNWCLDILHFALPGYPTQQLNQCKLLYIFIRVMALLTCSFPFPNPRCSFILLRIDPPGLRSLFNGLMYRFYFGSTCHTELQYVTKPHPPFPARLIILLVNYSLFHLRREPFHLKGVSKKCFMSPLTRLLRIGFCASFHTYKDTPCLACRPISAKPHVCLSVMIISTLASNFWKCSATPNVCTREVVNETLLDDKFETRASQQHGL